MFEAIASTGTLITPQITGAFHDAIVNLLNMALLLLVSGASWAVKTYIAHMQSGWKQTVAERLVKYAAQKLDNESNEQKRQWVADQISQHFPRITSDEANHLLEEAVVNLKTQLTTPPVTVAAPVEVKP